MKKIASILSAFVFVSLFGAIVAGSAVNAAPVDVLKDSCNRSGSVSEVCDNRSQQKLFGKGSVFQKITNAFLYLVGAISVIMIVFGGFRYAISNGDQSSITSAKNTILYAIVGLIIAISAYAIVNFVLIYV